MNFKILTFNVRGLNDATSIPLLQNYIQSVHGIDALFMKEHKARQDEGPEAGQRLWHITST